MLTEHHALVGIGANLGDPLGQCRKAVSKISSLPQTRLVSCSSFYKTPPLVTDGEKSEDIPWYINAACHIETGLDVGRLFYSLREIENKMGRVRARKWESRVIDLDLLFYDDLTLKEDDLCLPHPGIGERDFVLGPLAEIAPDWIHPRLGQSLKQLSRRLPSIEKLHKIVLPKFL